MLVANSLPMTPIQFSTFASLTSALQTSTHENSHHSLPITPSSQPIDSLGHSRKSTPLPHPVPFTALASESGLGDDTFTPTICDTSSATHIGINERAEVPDGNAECGSTKRVTSIVSASSKRQSIFRGLRERIPASMRPVSKISEEDQEGTKRQSKATTVRGGGMLMEPEPVLLETTKAPTGRGQAGMLSTLLQYYDPRREDGLPMDSHGHRTPFPFFLVAGAVWYMTV